MELLLGSQLVCPQCSQRVDPQGILLCSPHRSLQRAPRPALRPTFLQGSPRYNQLESRQASHRECLLVRQRDSQRVCHRAFRQVNQLGCQLRSLRDCRRGCRPVNPLQGHQHSHLASQLRTRYPRLLVVNQLHSLVLCQVLNHPDSPHSLRRLPLLAAIQAHNPVATRQVGRRVLLVDSLPPVRLHCPRVSQVERRQDNLRRCPPVNLQRNRRHVLLVSQHEHLPVNRVRNLVESLLGSQRRLPRASHQQSQQANLLVNQQRSPRHNRRVSPPCPHQSHPHNRRSLPDYDTTACTRH